MKSEPKVSHNTQRTSGLRFAKTDVRYWKPRLFKRTNDEWHVQIKFANRRERFPLRTPNKDAAAVTARDVYVSLLKDGWETTRERFKPWTVKEVIPPSSTVGEFLNQIKAVSDLKPGTFEIYARKFRRVVAGVAEIKGEKSRFDYTNGGSQRWRASVDAIDLAALSEARVQAWKVRFLSAAASNPLLHRRARTTVASLLRASKALFSKKVLRHLTVPIPEPTPFTTISVESVPNRYRSTINPALLAQMAERELAAAQPEQHKIFVLALGAGLRRDEIDTLGWKQFDWQRGTIRVETNAYTSAKSNESEAEVDIAPELVEFFKAHMQQSQSEFVINSAVAPRKCRPTTTTGAAGSSRSWWLGCAAKVSTRPIRFTPSARNTAV